MSDDVAIRPARPTDRAGIVELYNRYVRETAITFDSEPHTLQSRDAWFQVFAEVGRYRLLVAEDTYGAVVGYAASLPYRPKAAYQTSVETSIYLAPEASGLGLGSRLYDALFAALCGEDLHRALAGVTLPNPASLALHRRFGFREVGTFHEVGRKHGRYWDVLWLEKML